MREDSERELAASTAQRDAITSQLANVRQMLSTLGGAADALPPAAPAAPEQPEPEAQARPAAVDSAPADATIVMQAISSNDEDASDGGDKSPDASPNGRESVSRS